MCILLTLSVRTKKDLVAARQRARRVATLLRFDAQEQACIAAGAFAIGLEALRAVGPTRLRFFLEDATLRVFAVATGDKSAGSLMQLVKPLPSGPEFPSQDMQWISRQLSALEPVQVFDELARQNQEVLVLLHALHVAQSQLHLEKSRSRVPAA